MYHQWFEFDQWLKNFFATFQNGQTPLSIAQQLGYISAVEMLKNITEVTVTTTTTTVDQGKYQMVGPETMQETLLDSESEDEGGETLWPNSRFFWAFITKC